MMSALWKKEWLESVRTYRILFIPLLFILLAASNPIVYHYMPKILDQAGLPEGATFSWPEPSGAQVLDSSFEQLNQIGVLVIVLAAMGVVSREVEGGQAGLLFSLGISRGRYFGVKAAVFGIIVVLSVLLAMIASAYYTTILFEPVSYVTTLGASLIYSLHLLFVLALTLTLSARTANGLVAGALTIGATILFSILSLTTNLTDGLPNQAPNVASALLYGETVEVWRLLVVVAWTALVFALGLLFLKRREV